MKKILLILILFVGIIVDAQEPYKVYVELVGIQKGLFSEKVTITVDFGQEVSFWKRGRDNKIVDENGKDIVFNTMVDAMNFMGKRGWQFVQAYVVTEGNSNVYHWLLSKVVTSDDQIKDGFNVRADISVNNDPKYIITYYRKSKKAKLWEEVKTEKIPDLGEEQIAETMNEWRNQESNMYDYDCKLSKIK